MERAIVLSQEIIVHQERVAQLIKEFAYHLGLKETYISLIHLSAKNHDIGKSAIDESILKKPYKLTADEFNNIKEHVTEGAKILQSMNAKREVIEAVLFHHESYDGSGYPEKLKGLEIPLSARILKICDVYDALTSKRCYREKIFRPEEALSEMEKMKNQFDPNLFNEFTFYIKNTPGPKGRRNKDA